MERNSEINNKTKILLFCLRVLKLSFNAHMCTHKRARQNLLPNVSRAALGAATSL